jgi:hypothetical protein
MLCFDQSKLAPYLKRPMVRGRRSGAKTDLPTSKQGRQEERILQSDIWMELLLMVLDCVSPGVLERVVCWR